MLQRDGMVMVEMKVLVMMIPMKSSAMVTMMAILPESFSLLVFSAPQRRRCLSLVLTFT
jgi:hypothetical protein